MSNILKIRQNPWFWLVLGLAAILLRGLFDVMDVDASQYASVSMEMLQHGGWLGSLNFAPFPHARHPSLHD